MMILLCPPVNYMERREGEKEINNSNNAILYVA
jgi:hypothetical protein